MSFGSGPSVGGGAGRGGNVNAGPDLLQIETEQLAFQSVAGDDKLQLLPSPWPADSLPPPTSSLLSVASGKGLVAAAGPETLVISSTDSVRQAFIDESASAENRVRTFAPQATIQIPRISQLTFSSDESCLVIAAEQGGGLAVYDVNALTSGGKEPAFQLGTEGQSVRQVLPNPNPAQDLSRYFGVVTDKGQLLLADLKEQKLVQGANGSVVFHENVSCACWSRLGMQIVAGLANGTAVQIDRQGVVQVEIPEPPQLAGLKDASAMAYPITSIFWLDRRDFLIIHTPINQPGSGANDDSIYHLAHQDKTTQAWTFSKFEDPCPPFGMERRPANHYLQRLREWGSLAELVILASTASTDIGLFTRSKTALDAQNPIRDTFTWTQPPDQRRAAMPMSAADAMDTSPIGMAMDMSVKEKIKKPIPNDETLDESPVPLPALYVLNNEGMLSMWYIVYNESVRQNAPYPDLIAAGGPRPLVDQKQQPAAPSTSQQPASSGSAFGFAKPAETSSPFAAAARPPSSAGAPATPGFGSTSLIGNRQSPWAAPGSAATGGGGGMQFGRPSFGQPSVPSFGSSGFGQVGGMGVTKGSVWGTPQQQTPSVQSPPAASGSVFGGNTAQQSPFMNVGKGAVTSPFANLGGGSTAGKENQTPSIFGQSKPSLSAEPSGSTVSFGTGSSFNSGSTAFGVKSSFGSPSFGNGASGGFFSKPSAPASKEESMDDDDSSQPSTVKPAEESNKGRAFGLGAGGFNLGSTFKGDGTAKDDLPKPKDAGMGLFGKGFGDALGEPGKSGSEQAAWLSSGTSTPIKKEPGTGDGLQLKDIPATTTPAPKEEKQAAPPPADDAPLPPDPTTWKPKPDALPPPIPPGFGDDFGKPKEKKAGDAPPPLTFTSANNRQVEKPLAGSPPVDLGQDKFSEGVPSGSEEAGPPEDDDEEGWSDEEEEGDDEGDDEDSEEQRTPEVSDPKGLSAFEARLTPASEKRHEEQESTTPATDKKDSYTPVGLPKAPIMFAPPTSKGQESPRSPSPIRSATSPQRMMPNFTFGSQQQPPSKTLQQPSTASSSRTPSSSQLPPAAQSKSTASSLFGSSQNSQTTPKAEPRQPQRIAVPPAQLIASQQQRPSRPPSRPAEPEAGDLEDEEDARIQAILASAPEPTKEVPPFLTHQDYIGPAEGERAGLGGQIERVFRDVNSMVDTLALNARSLKGFVVGNQHPQGPKQERTRLDDQDGWRLSEAQILGDIMRDLDAELDNGRLQNVRDLLEQLREEDKEMNWLRTRNIEIRKQVQARREPELLDQQVRADLPLETQTQQFELRQAVQKVQKLLAKAEEHLSVLRAELASLPQKGGGTNGSVPTVEAVTNTILKMTAMVEKKSGDIDVLESQIRRLGGLKQLSDGYEDDLAASMKASRLSHSSPAAKANRASVFGSPAASRMRASRGASAGREGTPGTLGAKKSLFDVTDEEAEVWWAKKEARKRAMERLRDVVVERGPSVVRVGEVS